MLDGMRGPNAILSSLLPEETLDKAGTMGLLELQTCMDISAYGIIISQREYSPSHKGSDGVFWYSAK